MLLSWHSFEIEVERSQWDEIGSLEVLAWLRPIPPLGEKESINVDSFASFIDNDGCRTFAEMLGEHVVEKVSLVVLVLDSHTDALPAPISSDAIAYDMETNLNSLYDVNDPYFNKPSGFLQCLVFSVPSFVGRDCTAGKSLHHRHR